MRKRDLQSIPLKLAELKEYDAVKAERALNKSKGSSAEENASKEPSPIANVGPKTKKEIQDRLNATIFVIYYRNYCYERSIERRDINSENLRESNRGEKLNNGRKRENEFRQEHIENRDDVIKGVHENRVEMSDLESRRVVNRRKNQEIRRELDNRTPNRKEYTRRESNHIRNESREIVTDEDRSSESSKMDLLAEDSHDNYRDVDRSSDKTRRTQRVSERIVRRRQNLGENERESRSVTFRRVNERDNQQDEKRKSLRFSDRRENRIEILDFESRGLVSRRENREIHREIDNLTANLKKRTHRESYGIRNENRVMMDDNSAMVDEARRSESSRMDLLAKDNRDDHRDVDRSFDETHRTERNRERIVERRQNPAENERDYRSVTSRRFNEPDNQQNENQESLRLSDWLSETKQGLEQRKGREINTGNRKARRLNERMTGEKLEELHRIFEERTDEGEHCNHREDLTRTEVENQHDNTNANRLSNDRKPENERRFEHLRNDGSRRLSLKEWDTLHNYERRLENNRQKCVIRLKRNHESQRVNNRFTEVEGFSEERENLRRLSEQDNEWSRFNEDLSERDNRLCDINGELLNLNERHDERLQIISHIRNKKAQERGQRDRRETLRQLDNRNNRYDVGRRLNKKAQRQSEDKQEREDYRVRISRKDSQTKKRELKDRQEILKIDRQVTRRDPSRELNNRLERQNENLAMTENILNRNHESQRLNNELSGSERERERINHSLRQYENHVSERQDILLDEDIASRRFQKKYELVKTRDENTRQLDDRREELRKLEKWDNNRAFNEKQASQNDQLNRHNDDELLHRDENQRQQKQRSRSVRNDENQNYREYRNMINKYKDKPILSLNKSYMAFGQGALSAYVIMKTLNGKNDIKCNIYQNLLEAFVLMGF